MERRQIIRSTFEIQSNKERERLNAHLSEIRNAKRKFEINTQDTDEILERFKEIVEFTGTQLIDRTLLAETYPKHDEYEEALKQTEEIENQISEIFSSERNIAEIGRITRIRALTQLTILEEKTKERRSNGSYYINEIRDRIAMTIGAETPIGLTETLIELSQINEELNRRNQNYIATLTSESRREISNYIGELIKKLKINGIKNEEGA